MKYTDLQELFTILSVQIAINYCVGYRDNGMVLYREYSYRTQWACPNAIQNTTHNKNTNFTTTNEFSLGTN